MFLVDINRFLVLVQFSLPSSSSNIAACKATCACDLMGYSRLHIYNLVKRARADEAKRLAAADDKGLPIATV